jgi:hypothetical protein
MHAHAHMRVYACFSLLMFKEEEDAPESDLLDYVNLSEQEEDKLPNNKSYNFFVYTNFLIDSMALETGRNSRRRSIHLEYQEGVPSYPAM